MALLKTPTLLAMVTATVFAASSQAQESTQRIKFDDSRSISVRKPSLTPKVDLRNEILQKREDMFAELADEFNTFDRLGKLVRRVSTLVKPSVMHIEAHKSESNGGKQESYDEAGSGVVIRIDGSDWVLTNRHVILGSDASEIMLRSSDGREFRPSKILSDASTDVAIMRLTGLDVPAARIGNSERIQIGDFVIAIGSPFGLSHSVTFGILSAKGRRDLSLGEQN